MTGVQTCALPIYAAKVFTHSNFYILEQDLKKMGELEIFETLVGVDCHTFIVTWRNNRKFQFSVNYRAENSENTIDCSCGRMLWKGLPCKHILYVLVHLKISKIPKCCILKRMSKVARGGLPAQQRVTCLAGVGQGQSSVLAIVNSV